MKNLKKLMEKVKINALTKKKKKKKSWFSETIGNLYTNVK